MSRKRFDLFAILALLTFFAGCVTYVREETQKVQDEQSAQDAAVKRMLVTSHKSFKLHPNATELGPVQGVCGRPSKYSGEEQGAQGFRHAAYTKYGDKVDGIVGVTGWFVISPAASAEM